ncbi:hypothetical protein PMAYCL1PPCAC_20528, partial [Pristionchus mayeri]
LPMVYNYVHHVRHQLNAELTQCKFTARNVWNGVHAMRTAHKHANRTARQTGYDMFPEDELSTTGAPPPLFATAPSSNERPASPTGHASNSGPGSHEVSGEHGFPEGPAGSGSNEVVPECGPHGCGPKHEDHQEGCGPNGCGPKEGCEPHGCGSSSSSSESSEEGCGPNGCGHHGSKGPAGSNHASAGPRVPTPGPHHTSSSRGPSHGPSTHHNHNHHHGQHREGDDTCSGCCMPGPAGPPGAPGKSGKPGKPGA